MRRIRHLAFAILFCGVARGTLAAEIGEVVVTGLPEPKGDRAYDIVRVTPEKLMASSSGRLEDVLHDVAGFQEFRRSDSRTANPTSQGATLRALGGNASSRALVLLDGAPLADPFTGYIPWSALGPERLAGVRITRGAGAGAFGTGALTGVIELNSADPTKRPAGQAELDYGSRNSASASGVANAAFLGGGATLYGRYDRGDGYILIPERQRGPVDIATGYSQGSVGLHAVAPLSDQTRLSLNTLAFDDQRVQGLTGTTTEVKGVESSLRVIGEGAWRWESLAYLQVMNFTNTVAAVNTLRTVQTPTLNEYDTPATGFGGKFEVRPPVGDHAELRLGVDLRDATGHTHELSKYIRGRFTQLLNAGGHERIFGGYVESSAQPIPHLTLTAGGRIDHWSIDAGSVVESNVQTLALVDDEHPAARAAWQSTARGGVAWDVTPVARLRVAGYFGYRLPSLNELYRPFRVGTDATAANAALRPETLKGVEAGIDAALTPAVRLGLTVFVNRLDNAIANVTLDHGPGSFPQVGFVVAGGAFSQRRNLDAIIARGVEAEAHATITQWRFDASYIYTHARDLASGPAAALNGLPPAQTPTHQASATLGWTPYADALLAVTGRYSSGQSENDLATRRLTSAATLGAIAELPIARGVKLILRAENITNAQIETGISSTGLITIGTPRTLWAGVRVAL